MPAPSSYLTSLNELFSTYAGHTDVQWEVLDLANLLLIKLVDHTPQDQLDDQAYLQSKLKQLTRQLHTPQQPARLVRTFIQHQSLSQAAVMLGGYLLALSQNGCSASTLKNYRSDINQFFAFTANSSLNASLTKPKVASFLKWQHHKGLTTASIKRKVVALTQFAEWLEQKEVVPPGRFAWLPKLNANFDTVFDELISEKSGNKTQKYLSKNKSQQQKTAGTAPVVLSTHQLQDTADFTKRKPNSTPIQSRQEHRHQLKQAIQDFNARWANQARQSLLPYINLLLSLLLFLGMGYFAYLQFFTEPDMPLAYPTSLTRPNRTLSFQGRLTDTAQNPITGITAMRFQLYDEGPSTTSGNILWDSTSCNVDPDQDGIFSVGLGSECGGEITENVFSENSNVWLQVEIESEVLNPRQSIKTVPYALNAETVQGYPASASAVENTVLVMDNNGEIVLGNANPVLKSTGDSFAIEAQTLTLRTAAGSDGDIVLAPDGDGKSIAQSDLDVTGFIHAPGATFSANYAGGIALVLQAGPSATADIMRWNDSAGTQLGVIDEGGNVGIGTSDPAGKLHINTNGDAVIGQIIRANSGSQTANLSEWQDHTGSTLTYFTPEGYLGMNGNLALKVPSVDTIMIGNTGNTANSGVNNFFAGYGAGASNTDGYTNLFIGKDAGHANTTADYNLFIGSSAGAKTVDGGNNTFIGRNAGLENVSGEYNIFLGTGAGQNSTVSYNTAIGSSSLFTNTTGGWNTAIGYGSLYNNTDGEHNTSIGYASGYYNQGGDQNVFIGFQAGRGPSAQSISGNVFIGYQAGYNETTSNKLYIENSNSSSPLIYGDFATDVVGIHGSLGIGTTSPSSLFSVGASSQFQVDSNGDIVKLKNLTYSWPSSHVTDGFLKNDGSGNLVWTTNITANALKWNALTNPDDNLSLSMGAYTTSFTWGATTGAGVNLFNLADTTNNTGTGYLLNIATATGSTLQPLRVAAAGVEALAIDADGNVGIGTTSPTSKLDISGAITSSNVGAGSVLLSTNYAEALNLATNQHPTPNNSLTALGIYDADPSKYFFGSYDLSGGSFFGMKRDGMYSGSIGMMFDNWASTNRDFVSGGTGIQFYDGSIEFYTYGELTAQFEDTYDFQLFKDGTAIVELSGSGTSYINAGNLGIGTTSPSSLFSVGASSQFQVDSNGDIVKLKNLTYSWPSSHVTDGFLKNDGSGNLVWTTNITANALKWNALTNPDDNLSLSMGAYTTSFTWGATTGAGVNLFNLADTTNNTGTGYLLNIATATGSTLQPLRVAAAGVEALAIDADGSVGIGTTSPNFKLNLSAGTTAVEGIGFGTDTNLYRSAADTLKTDDNLVVGTLGAGSTDTVVTHSSGTLQTRTIDSRVWGSSLVDGSGTNNYLAKWTPDSNTIGNSVVYDDGTNVGIGTTTPTAKLHVINDDERAIHGESFDNQGVYGKSTNDSGVYGYGVNYVGVRGYSTDGYGVWGSSANNWGVYGSSQYEAAVVGQSSSKQSGYFYRNSASPTTSNFEINTLNAADDQTVLYIAGSGTGDLINVFDGASEVFTIVDGGNVGIGTTSPAFKLDVAGVTRTQDLITQDITLSSLSTSIITALYGHAGYTNFSGGIGTGGIGKDSITGAQRITSQGNLVNIGSIQAGELLLTSGGTFATKVDYPTGTSPYSVAIGDLNGDGKADLAVANNGSSSVSVLLNNGDGTFASKVDYAAGTWPSVTIGDLNGDGKADLAVGSWAANSVSVFINNGDGTFASKVDYATGSGPRSVAIGDLDGDGKADLAVANGSSNTISVFINNGDGTFASKVDYATGSLPFSVAIGDLNGDGKADLAVANSSSITISVFINNGDGTFATKADYTVGSIPRSVAIGDLDGDGKADLAVANASSSSVSVLMNNASPMFYAQARTGRVGIGSITPQTKLQIVGSDNTTNPGEPTNAALRIVQNATGGYDRRGEIQFAFGSDDRPPSAVIAGKYTSWTSGWTTVLGASLAFATTPVDGTLTDRMIITHDGNVGIGTTAPTSVLEIVGSDGGAVQLSSSAGVSGTMAYIAQGRARFGYDGTTSDVLISDNGTNKDIRFSANSVDRLFIKAADGNVGIGDTTPNAPLTIKASSTADQAVYQTWRYSQSGSDQYSLKLKQTVTSGVVRYTFDMINNNTAYNNVLTLDRGNVGIGTTNPGAKLHVAGTSTLNGAVNMAVSVWHTSTDGTSRLHFGDGGSTYIRTASSVIFRNVDNDTIMTINSNGTLTLGAQATAITHAVSAGRSIGTGDGLSGGGNLTANRTLSLDTTFTNALYVNKTGDTMSGTLSMGDNQIQNIRGLQGKDWDDDSGGADNKYRVLYRDGAHMFYDGGVAIGQYSNGTWTDLADGQLIVSGNVGIGTTSPNQKLHVVGVINATTGYRINNAATNGSFLRGNGTNFVASTNGSTLTSLNATNLSSGTVANARISGAYSGITTLAVSGTLTLSSTGSDVINLSGSVTSNDNHGIAFNNRTALSADSDGWLRLNNGDEFTSGTFISGTTYVGAKLGVTYSNPSQTIQIDADTYGNSSGWINSSDRNKKENFTKLSDVSLQNVGLGTWEKNGAKIDAVEYEDGFAHLTEGELLNRLELLPLYRYNYISDTDTNPSNPGGVVYHISPIAQDFYKLFGLSSNDTRINATDIAGIALAGIKAMKHKIDHINFESDTGLIISESDDTYTLTATPTNAKLTNVLAAAEVVTAKLRAGLTTTKQLVVEQTATIADLSVNTLKVGGQNIADYINSLVDQRVSQQMAELPAADATSSAEIATLDVAELTADNSTINALTSDKSILGELLAETATISGDLTVAGSTRLGSFIADSATVSGTLVANRLVLGDDTSSESAEPNLEVKGFARIAQLESKMATLEKIKATTAELTTATVSGTLYANNIYNIDQMIADNLQQPGLLDTLLGNYSAPEAADATAVYDPIEAAGYEPINPELLATSLADLQLEEGDVVLGATAILVERYFQVNGTAYVAENLGIGELLQVGSGLMLADGMIEYAPAGIDQPILSIQPSGRGRLEMLAGLMSLENGRVEITGELKVAGSVEVENTLLTDLIAPTDFGNPLQVQVAGIATESGMIKQTRFEIVDESGQAVASFDAEGNADFAGGIGVGKDDLTLAASINDVVTTNSTSGKAVLPARKSQLTIQTNQIKEDSLIYITPRGSTRNQVLYVKSQVNGSFTVGLDKPIENDVEFNWWIVQ